MAPLGIRLPGHDKDLAHTYAVNGRFINNDSITQYPYEQPIPAAPECYRTGKPTVSWPPISR